MAYPDKYKPMPAAKNRTNDVKMTHPKSEILRAHIAVLFTNLFFAINYSLVKFVSPNPVGPFAVNMARVSISVILFWAVWLFGNTPLRVEKKDRGRLFLCAVTGIAANQTLFIKGLTLTSTIHAALLTLVTPIVVMLAAIWILKERFTVFKAAGLSLGISGAVFIAASLGLRPSSRLRFARREPRLVTHERNVRAI